MPERRRATCRPARIQPVHTLRICYGKRTVRGTTATRVNSSAWPTHSRATTGLVRPTGRPRRRSMATLQRVEHAPRQGRRHVRRA
eukprot:6125453-Prymnesium_polylepis.1